MKVHKIRWSNAGVAKTNCGITGTDRKVKSYNDATEYSYQNGAVFEASHKDEKVTCGSCLKGLS